MNQQTELPDNIECRSCDEPIIRQMRCPECGQCPICCDRGFLRDEGTKVIPCYNCNPDGMEHTD